MSTLTHKRNGNGYVKGKPWHTNSRESKARHSAVTIAKRQSRRKTRQTVRMGEFDTLINAAPMADRMAQHSRCPFCGTPFWFCPC